MGQKQTRRGQMVMSALPQKAAATVADRRERFELIADIAPAHSSVRHFGG